MEEGGEGNERERVLKMSAFRNCLQSVKAAKPN